MRRIVNIALKSRNRGVFINQKWLHNTVPRRALKDVWQKEVKQTLYFISYLQKLTLYLQPGYAVVEEDSPESEMEPTDVPFQYLKPEKRLEMWEKHRDNPSEWTIAKLAETFKTSVMRTKALIVIMSRREVY